MKIDQLKHFLGLETQTPATPSDLEIALARIHADHKTAMVAIKLLTEAVQSGASGNLDMSVVHEERHKTILKNMRELKQEMYHSDKRHLAAFELAMRPMTRAIEDMNKNLSDKLSGIDADIHALRVDLTYDREAWAAIQNTKLNAIAERLDDLAKVLAKEVAVAPSKKPARAVNRGGGRKKGVKVRPLDVRYADLSNRIQRCHPNSKIRLKYMLQLVALREKMGMAPIKRDSQ